MSMITHLHKVFVKVFQSSPVTFMKHFFQRFLREDVKTGTLVVGPKMVKIPKAADIRETVRTPHIS